MAVDPRLLAAQRLYAAQQAARANAVALSPVTRLQAAQAQAQQAPARGAAPTNPIAAAGQARRARLGQTQQQSPGGVQGAIGSVFGNTIVKGIMAPLQLLDLPRRGVVAGLESLAEVLPEEAEWLMPATKLVDEKRTADNGGFWDHFRDSDYGFGQIAQQLDTGTDWLDTWGNRGIGFLGDVALDPTTYLLPGASEFAGIGGRAALAGEGALKGLGEEAVSRIGRVGEAGLSKVERETLGLGEAGIRFGTPKHNFRIPGTGGLQEGWLKGSAAVKNAIGDTGIGSAYRRFRMDEKMRPYLERLIAGKGEMSATEAANMFASLSAKQGAAGGFFGAFTKDVTQLAKKYTGRTDLTHALESGVLDADGQALQAVKDAMFAEAKGKGVSALKYRQQHVPHYNTDDFEEFLGRATDNGTGLTRKGGSQPKGSGRLESRVWEPNTDYTINGVDIHLDSASMDDISKKFQAAFPTELGGKKLIEDDPGVWLPKLLEDHANDVGTAAWEQRMKEGGSLVDEADVMEQVPDKAATKEARDELIRRAKVDLKARRQQRTDLAKAIRDKVGAATKAARKDAEAGVGREKARGVVAGAYLNKVDAEQGLVGKAAAAQAKKAAAEGKAARAEWKRLYDEFTAADDEVSRLQKVWHESDAPTAAQAYQLALDKRRGLVEQIKTGLEAEKVQGQLTPPGAVGAAARDLNDPDVLPVWEGLSTDEQESIQRAVKDRTYDDVFNGRSQVDQSVSIAAEMERRGHLDPLPTAPPSRVFVGQAGGPPTAITPRSAEEIAAAQEGLASRTMQRQGQYERSVTQAGDLAPDEAFTARLAGLAEGRTVAPMSDAEATLARMEGVQAPARARKVKAAVGRGAETGQAKKDFPYGDIERKAAKRELTPDELTKGDLFTPNVMAQMPPDVQQAWTQSQQDLEELLAPFRTGPTVKKGTEVTEEQALTAANERKAIQRDIDRLTDRIEKLKIGTTLERSPSGGVVTRSARNTDEFKQLNRQRDELYRQMREAKKASPVSQAAQVDANLSGAITRNPAIQAAIDRSQDGAEFIARYYRAIGEGALPGPELDRAVAEQVLQNRASRNAAKLTDLREATGKYRVVAGKGKQVPRYTDEEIDELLETQWNHYVRGTKANIKAQMEANRIAEQKANVPPLPDPPVRPKRPTIAGAQKILRDNGGTVSFGMEENGVRLTINDPKVLLQNMQERYPEEVARFEKNLAAHDALEAERERELRHLEHATNQVRKVRVPQGTQSKAQFFAERRKRLQSLTRSVAPTTEKASAQAADRAMAGEFAAVLAPLMDDVATTRAARSKIDATIAKARTPKVYSTTAIPPEELERLREAAWGYEQQLTQLRAQRAQLQQHSREYRPQFRQQADAHARLQEARTRISQAEAIIEDSRKAAARARRKGMSTETRQRLLGEGRRAREAMPRLQEQLARRETAYDEAVAAFTAFRGQNEGLDSLVDIQANIDDLEQQVALARSGRVAARPGEAPLGNFAATTGAPMKLEDWQAQMALPAAGDAKRAEVRIKAARELGIGGEGDLTGIDLDQTMMTLQAKARKQADDSEREVMRTIEKLTGVKWDEPRKAITTYKGKGTFKYLLGGHDLDSEQMRKYIIAKGVPEEAIGETRSIHKMLQKWAEFEQPGVQDWNKATINQLAAALKLDDGKALLQRVRINRKLTAQEQMAVHLEGAANDAYAYIDNNQAAAIHGLYGKMGDDAKGRLFAHVDDRRRVAEMDAVDTNRRLGNIDAPGGGVNVSHDPVAMVFGRRTEGELLPVSGAELGRAGVMGETVLPAAQDAAQQLLDQQQALRSARTSAATLAEQQTLDPINAKYAAEQANIDPNRRLSNQLIGMSLDEQAAVTGAVRDEFGQLRQNIGAEMDPRVKAARQMNRAVNTVPTEPIFPGTVDLSDVGGGAARRTARADIAANQEALAAQARNLEEFQQGRMSNMLAQQAPDVASTQRAVEGQLGVGEARQAFDVQRQAGLQQQFEELGGQGAIEQGQAARAAYTGQTPGAMAGEIQSGLREPLHNEMVEAAKAARGAKAQLAAHEQAMSKLSEENRTALGGFHDAQRILAGHEDAALQHAYAADDLLKQAKAQVEQLKKTAPKRNTAKGVDVGQSYMDWINDTEKFLGSDMPQESKDLVTAALNDAVGRVMPNGKVVGGFQRIDRKIAGGEKFIEDVKSGKVVQMMKDQMLSGYTAFKSKVSGEDLAMSVELDRAMKNIATAFEEPGAIGAALDTYTKFFKAYATATPGFHLRNAMSATFMNASDGVSIPNMIGGTKIWSAHRRNPTGEWWLDPSIAKYRDVAQDVVKSVYESGAGGQFSAQEIGERAFGRSGSRAKQAVTNNAYVRGSRRLGEGVEGAARAGMALDSLTRGGIAGRSGSVAGATARINRIHFNYSQASKLDAKIRRVVPFWTFISRNVPLQVQQMWTNPRAYLHYQSAVRNFRDPNSDDSLLPDWMRQSGAFRVSPGLALMPDIGATQMQANIEQLTTPTKLLSMLGPQFKTPLQLATNKNFFYGNDYSDTDMVPLTGAMSLAAPVLATLGLTEDIPGGGLAVPRKYADAARDLIPLLANADRTTGDHQSQGLRSFFGIPARDVTPEMLTNEQKRRKGQATSSKTQDAAMRKALQKLAAAG